MSSKPSYHLYPKHIAILDRITEKANTKSDGKRISKSEIIRALLLLADKLDADLTNVNSEHDIFERFLNLHQNKG